VWNGFGESQAHFFYSLGASCSGAQEAILDFYGFLQFLMQKFFVQNDE